MSPTRVELNCGRIELNWSNSIRLNTTKMRPKTPQLKSWFHRDALGRIELKLLSIISIRRVLIRLYRAGLTSLSTTQDMYHILPWVSITMFVHHLAKS